MLTTKKMLFYFIFMKVHGYEIGGCCYSHIDKLFYFLNKQFNFYVGFVGSPMYDRITITDVLAHKSLANHLLHGQYNSITHCIHIFHPNILSPHGNKDKIYHISI